MCYVLLYIEYRHILGADKVIINYKNMGNFRGNDRSGGSRSGGRGGYGSGRSRDGGGRDSARSEMHDATCSDCGKNCQVPFRPTGTKPVYCSDCFRDHDNDSGGGRDRGGDRGRGRDRGGRDGGRRDSGRFGGDKEMHKAVCDKCGVNCEVPFKPTSDKPIYCSDCFGEMDQGKGRDNKRSDSGKSDVSIKMLAEINDKLERIMKALITDAPVVRHRIELDDKKSKVSGPVKPKRANRKAPSKPKKVSKKKEIKEKAKKVAKKAVKKAEAKK